MATYYGKQVKIEDSPAEIERMLKQAGFAEVRVKTIKRGQIIWGTGYHSSFDSSKHPKV